MVRSRYGRGAVAVRSRFGRGAARHSMVAVRSRYSLGTLPVRSWYGILKVRSRLVFSTRLEPGTRTVRFIVRIAQSRLSWIRFGHRYYTLRNVLYSIYGLADSDRDQPQCTCTATGVQFLQNCTATLIACTIVPSSVRSRCMLSLLRVHDKVL